MVIRFEFEKLAIESEALRESHCGGILWAALIFWLKMN